MQKAARCAAFASDSTASNHSSSRLIWSLFRCSFFQHQSWKKMTPIMNMFTIVMAPYLTNMYTPVQLMLPNMTARPVPSAVALMNDPAMMPARPILTTQSRLSSWVMMTLVTNAMRLMAKTTVEIAKGMLLSIPKVRWLRSGISKLKAKNKHARTVQAIDFM